MPCNRLSLFAIISAFFLNLSATYPQTGSIKGVVTDKKTGESIVGAHIIIEGTLTGTSTDLDGTYEIKNLKPGTYNLVISFISYKSQTLKGITVRAGQATVVNIQLEEEITMIEGVQVTSRRRTDTEIAILSTIKQSEIVVSGISAQQIAKSQDSDASMVIKRIPGVTVVEDRFIMIRGLSERYNPTLLHNVFAPSMEADIRSFSFDIIPSPLVDQILIYKSPMAELPGDFSGGIVKVFTRNIPDENSLTVSLSSSYLIGSSMGKFQHQKNGKTYWLGFNDGHNNLPKDFPKNLRSIMNNPEAVTAAGRSLQNNWTALESNAGLNNTLLVTYGWQYTRKKMRIGNITSLIYSNSKSTDDITRQDFNRYDDELGIKSVIYRFNDNQNNQRIRTGLLFNWALVPGKDHLIEFKNMFNQISIAQYVIRTGRHFEFNYNANNHSFYNLYRGIYSGQLLGKHDLNNKQTTVEWVGGYGFSYREEPDYRRYRSDLDSITGDITLYVPVGAAASYFLGRFFSEMYEHSFTGAVTLRQKIQLPGILSNPLSVALGAFFEDKQREFNSRNLGYVRANSSLFDMNLLNVTIDSLFHPQNINMTYGIKIDEQTNPSDSYSAENQLKAYFAQVDLPVSNRIRLGAGLRIEDNTQIFNSYTLTNDPVNVHNPVVSFLPSFYSSYHFNENTLLRFTMGKTVNRPEFRELAPFGFYDFNYNLVKKGNENLKTATIHNFDLRLENYPTPAEIIMFGIFYKTFFNPIESSFIPGGGTAGIKTFSYVNANKARSLGAETEIRKSLTDLTNSIVLDRLTLLFNSALISSKVDLGQAGFGTYTSRPMMGQSPFIVNAGIYYNDFDRKLHVNVLYNVVGRRIFLIGYEDYPDIYEMPRNLVDVTITKGIGKNIELKAGIRDLLNEKHYLIQDANQDGKFDRIKDHVIQEYAPGRVINASLTLKF